METRSVQAWLAKQAIALSLAILSAYLTYSCFEQGYSKMTKVAMTVGLADLLGPEKLSERQRDRFGPRSGLSGLPLRGTIVAHGQDQQRRVALEANTFGHFITTALIRGQQLEFMTDTGATYVALTYETAQRLGLSPQNLHFAGRSTTANGIARVASVMLDCVQVGEIQIRDVQAVVAEPGRMTQNLLGMSFIKRLSGFEMNGSRLTMIE